MNRYFIPGRIEVLGKHTDYAGGRSILCAIERGITLSVSPRSDAVVHVRDLTNGIECTFPLDPDLDRVMLCGSPGMLSDFRALLDGRGFVAAPRIGTPGHYVFERAFVEK